MKKLFLIFYLVISLFLMQLSFAGEIIDPIINLNELNYGENLGDVSKVLNHSSAINIFTDDEFDNGVDTKDYTQKLVLSNGEFNYALKDSLDDVETIRDGIFYAGGEIFATYTLELESSIDLSSFDELDFLSEELTIMDRTFSIVGMKVDGSNNLNELSLIDNENKISLGEGENQTIIINNQSYDITLYSVSNEKILLSVNGQSKYLKEFEIEAVAGVNVVVTDLVSSSRDAVKGYAEIVVGGQEITLVDSGLETKINGYDLSDFYDLYDISSDFIGTGFDTIQITYKVDDDTLLEVGDSLNDVLFETFSLEFDRTNSPYYSELEVSVNGGDIELSGTTEENEEFNQRLLHLGDDSISDSAVWLVGDNDEDRFFISGSLDLTGGNGISNLNYFDGTFPALNLTSTDVKGLRFLLEVDNDEQYLYELKTIDTSSPDNEVDFDELLTGRSEEDVRRNEWNTKLQDTGFYVIDITPDNFVLNQTAFGNKIAFENELLVNLELAESLDISGGDSVIDFELDTFDAQCDVSTDNDDIIRLTFAYDAGDNEFDILTPTISSGTVNSFVNPGDEDNVDGSSDWQTFVTRYGVKVEYDNDERSYIKILTPDEQVKGIVNLNFDKFNFGSNLVNSDNSNGGSSAPDQISLVRPTKSLNYGENVNDIVVFDLDDSDTSYLRDENFENGVSNTEYVQNLKFENGEFNYALRDEVEGVISIGEGIFYADDEIFATYNLELDSAIDLTNFDEFDFIGEELKIMGKNFVITQIEIDGSNNLTKLVLVNSESQISLGEGETSTVILENISYLVEVLSVADDKVLLAINDEPQSIDIYDSEEVSGIMISVTDLVSSSRDSVKGYAEIIVGGDKLTLRDENQSVLINDELSYNVFNDYNISSDFTGSGISNIIIRYSVTNNTLLEINESLDDVLFDSFKLEFNNNNVEYEEIELRVNGDRISIEGNLISGEMFNKDLIYSSTTNGLDGITYFRGDNDEDRIFYDGSVILGTTIDLDSSGNLNLDFTNTDIKGSGFFVYNDLDEQYLYEIVSVDTTDKMIDLEELLENRDESNIELDELGRVLDVSFETTNTTNQVNITLGSNFTPILAFENELLMNFEGVEDSLGVDNVYLTFSLDDLDIDPEDSADGDENYNITLDWDNGDLELDLIFDGSQGDFVNVGFADNVVGDSDVQTYVTKYGSKIIYDNEDNTFIRILVPDEQVEANFKITIGNLNEVPIVNSSSGSSGGGSSGSSSSNSQFESIESFTVSYDNLTGIYIAKISVKASSFYESVALYIDNGDSWDSLCEFDRRYVNGVESFSCDGEIPFTFKDGEHTLKATTNYCGGSWAQNPKQNCGDFKTFDITLNRGITSDNALVIMAGNVGFGINNPQRTVHIKDALRLEPRSTAPSNPSMGDLYVDSDSNELCFYDGLIWTGIKAGGICS